MVHIKRKDGNDGFPWIDELFNSLAHELGFDMRFSPFARVFTKQNSPQFCQTLAPAADFFEDGNKYIIELEAPGFSKEEITIEAFPEYIILSGQQKEIEDKDKEGNAIHVIRQERKRDRFSRKYTFKIPVDPETTKATMENGILHIEIQKSEKAKGKKISIT